jgi:hypothetical protein
MKNKWTIILGVIGFIIGLIHPSNSAFGVGMPEAIAFAVPWVIFLSLIGLAIDYFIEKKDSSKN